MLRLPETTTSLFNLAWVSSGMYITLATAGIAQATARIDSTSTDYSTTHKSQLTTDNSQNGQTYIIPA